MNEKDDGAPQSEEQDAALARDARLSRAAMKSLAVSAPADLKAELKRRARARAAFFPRLMAWSREMLSGGAWAYGAGAALAAAAVAVVVLRAVPERPRAVETFVDVSAASALADLWADDEGKDDDES